MPDSTKQLYHLPFPVLLYISLLHEAVLLFSHFIFLHLRLFFIVTVIHLVFLSWFFFSGIFLFQVLHPYLPRKQSHVPLLFIVVLLLLFQCCCQNLIPCIPCLLFARFFPLLQGKAPCIQIYIREEWIDRIQGRVKYLGRSIKLCTHTQ